MPGLLLIARERLHPGTEAAYGEIERTTAAASARLGCPHPYLALAPVDGTPEVWWVNSFASDEDRAQVEAAYAGNQRLMSVLQTQSERKRRFVQQMTMVLAARRADLGGEPLRVAGARFFVVSRQPLPDGGGAGFESPEGERFVFASAASRAAADRIAAGVPGSLILAVQPRWSFADQEWIAADRDFWGASDDARATEG